MQEKQVRTSIQHGQPSTLLSCQLSSLNTCRLRTASAVCSLNLRMPIQPVGNRCDSDLFNLLKKTSYMSRLGTNSRLTAWQSLSCATTAALQQPRVILLSLLIAKNFCNTTEKVLQNLLLRLAQESPKANLGIPGNTDQKRDASDPQSAHLDVDHHGRAHTASNTTQHESRCKTPVCSSRWKGPRSFCTGHQCATCRPPCTTLAMLGLASKPCTDLDCPASQ